MAKKRAVTSTPSADTLQKIAQKALTDSAFLSTLKADPASAAAQVGASLTSDQARRIKDLSADDWMRLSLVSSADEGVNEAQGLW